MWRECSASPDSLAADTDLDKARTAYEAAHEADPHALDSVDEHSNVLFVLGDRAALAELAHNAVHSDKYSPRVCYAIGTCSGPAMRSQRRHIDARLMPRASRPSPLPTLGSTGNYYSLRGEHERAVVYFKRALRLNPDFVSAWTLLGHEYMELRNTHAAVEAYRRAMSISPDDYRAWYGLGQAYELLDMPSYAVYYYRRASVFRYVAQQGGGRAPQPLDLPGGPPQAIRPAHVDCDGILLCVHASIRLRADLLPARPRARGH